MQALPKFSKESNSRPNPHCGDLVLLDHSITILATFLAAIFVLTPTALYADAVDSGPAREALQELVGQKIARQVHLSHHSSEREGDVFRISGMPGAVHISGTSNIALLTGFNWYSKFAARAIGPSRGPRQLIPGESRRMNLNNDVVYR
jgi:hypothetical protein